MHLVTVAIYICTVHVGRSVSSPASIFKTSFLHMGVTDLRV